MKYNNVPPMIGKSAFQIMVDEDIERCDAILATDFDKEKWSNFYTEITSRYVSHISNLGDNLYSYNKNYKFFDPNIGESTYIHNLLVIKNRLIAFKNYGYRNSELSSGNSINVNNNLTANQSVSLDISFEQVIEQVKAMDGLSDSDTIEVLKKIDEIKAIVEAHETKKAKWQKMKSVLVWIANKSVEVGIALLPLIMQIGR